MITNTNKQNVLLISTMPGFGGGEIYAINLYKELLKEQNINPVFLVAKNSGLEKACKEQTLSYFCYRQIKLPFKIRIELGLKKAIQDICTQQKIAIIHTNNKHEVGYVRQAVKNLGTNIPIIHTHHAPRPVSPELIEKTDGIVCVNTYVAQETQEQYKNFKNLFTTIAPFFNEKKFLAFTPEKNISRKNFFRKTFNVQIPSNTHVICAIGKFSSHMKRKNFSILFQACKSLIKEHNKNIHIVLAGDGPKKNYYKRLVRSLGIHEHVHFLGYTTQTPAILFHSDFLVHGSSTEGFGIIAQEAALMKKPSIMAHKTGAAGTLILHEQTGLLFEPDNTQDLTKQIALLVNNPELCKKLGHNAYQHVQTNFSNKINKQKLIAFYNQSKDRARCNLRFTSY